MLSLKTLSMCVAVLALAACASVPPGEDDTGKDMKHQAAPVTSALAHYYQDYGRYPSSLYELIPKYLKNVPFAPNLQFDSEQGTLGLYYKAPWPTSGGINCVTPLQSPTWVCRSAP